MRRGLMACALALAFASCSGPDILNLFVGTYSDGFYAYDFDQRSGRFVGDGPVAKAEMPNPSYLTVSGNKVYAVSEMPDTTASVWAWRWCGNGFELLGAQPTGLPGRGEDPCYVSTDGTVLAVANYSGGTLATYRLREDGSIAPLDSLLISGTGGPCRARSRRTCIAGCSRLMANTCSSVSSVPMRSAASRLSAGECATIAAPPPCIPTTAPGICCSTLQVRICT